MGRWVFSTQEKLISTRFVQELMEGLRSWSERWGLCFQRVPEEMKVQQGAHNTVMMVVAAWLSVEKNSNWMWAVDEWMRSACSKADVQVQEGLYRTVVVR